MFMGFEIASSDIVFLSYIEDSVSRQPSLLMGISIEVELGDGSDRDEGSGIIQ